MRGREYLSISFIILRSAYLNWLSLYNLPAVYRKITEKASEHIKDKIYPFMPILRCTINIRLHINCVNTAIMPSTANNFTFRQRGYTVPQADGSCWKDSMQIGAGHSFCRRAAYFRQAVSAQKQSYRRQAVYWLRNTLFWYHSFCQLQSAV